MDSLRYAIFVLTILVALDSSRGYRYGPPSHTPICASMFPEGHSTDAQTNSPPFEIKVNQTTYSPGDVIEVKINAKNDTKQSDGRAWFYEGLYVQVRSRNCGSVTAVGSFKVQENEDILQPIDCFSLKNSAVRHYNHVHIYNRTFYWTAPSTAVGHVYVRATIARNQAMFWTNLRSDYILDNSDTTTNPAYCQVQTTYTRLTCAAVSVWLSPVVLVLTVLSLRMI